MEEDADLILWAVSFTVAIIRGKSKDLKTSRISFNGLVELDSLAVGEWLRFIWGLFGWLGGREYLLWKSGAVFLIYDRWI